MRLPGDPSPPAARRRRLLRALGLTLLALSSLSCAAPREIEDVSYDARFDRTKLDLFLPDNGARPPLVMLIHGGAWAYGDKDHMRRMARRLARSGYAAAAINYRLTPEGRFPNNVQDVGCALAFLQASAAEYSFDPARVAVLGYSAGGHLTAMLGVAWDNPRFAPDCAAGTPAFAPAGIIPGASVYDFHGADNGLVEDYLGGSEEQIPEIYRDASPRNYVRPGLPPFLLITGGADWFVGIDATRDMGAALRADGNQAEVMSLAGAGHLFSPGADPGDLQFGVSIETPEAWLALIDFLERSVGAP